MESRSTTLFMSAAVRAAAERRFRKALGLLRTAWVVEGAENIGTWLTMLEASAEAQAICLEGLLAERSGKLAIATVHYARAKALEPIARHRLARLRFREHMVLESQGAGRPLGSDERATLEADLATIERLARSEAIAAAVDQAQSTLRRIRRLPGLQANVERNLLPRLAQNHWHTLPAEALASAMRSEFLRTPSSSTLRNWAIATFRLAAERPEHASSAVSVGMTAIANLEADTQLVQPPWLPDGTSAIALLRAELLEWMEGWTRHDPEARDRLRLDRLALRWRGKRRRGPHLDGLAVMPSLMFDPLVSARCGERALESSSSLLAALYSPWGLATAAAEAGDYARLAYLDPEMAGSAAEQAGADYCHYIRGLRALRHGDLEFAIPLLGQLPREREIREDLKVRLAASCQEGFTQLGGTSLAKRLAFAKFRHAHAPSAETSRWLADLQAEQIRVDWTGGQLSDADALFAARDLLEASPNSDAAVALLEELELVVFGSLDADGSEGNEEDFELEF